MTGTLGTVASIVDEVVRPLARDVDRNREFPTESIAALAEGGVLALTIPKEFGGLEARPGEIAAIGRHVAAACASTAMVLVMHWTSLSTVIQFARTEEQRAVLRSVVKDRKLVTEAISEPGSGSQWWSVASVATPTTHGYAVDANKSFVTSAGHADYYVVSTRAPGVDDERRHALFVIPSETPGITVGAWQGLGLRGNYSTSVRFECEVPRHSMLYGGDDDDGLRKYNEVNQPIYHLAVSSAYCGIASAALSASVQRIRNRRYTGSPTAHGPALSDYPVARRHLGEMAIRVAQADGMVSVLARSLEEGACLDDVAVHMTATKVAAAEAAFATAREAMMACGGLSYLEAPLSVERHLRDAAAASLMGPNDDFCKELIGRLIVDPSVSYHDL